MSTLTVLQLFAAIAAGQSSSPPTQKAFNETYSGNLTKAVKSVSGQKLIASVGESFEASQRIKLVFSATALTLTANHFGGREMIQELVADSFWGGNGSINIPSAALFASGQTPKIQTPTTIDKAVSEMDRSIGKKQLVFTAQVDTARGASFHAKDRNAAFKNEMLRLLKGKGGAAFKNALAYLTSPQPQPVFSPQL